MLPAQPFYLVRHGQTEANVHWIAAGGGTDSLLTDKGRAQADMLAPVLGKLEDRPAVIYHSPMSRARETAERINAQLRLPMESVPDLQEIMLGDWEGQDWRAVVEPKIMQDQKPPGGESKLEYTARVQSVLGKLLSRDHKAPPLIVAHGGTFHCIARMYHKDYHFIENCHLHRYDPYSEYAEFPWRLSEFNLDRDELKQSPSDKCYVKLHVDGLTRP